MSARRIFPVLALALSLGALAFAAWWHFSYAALRPIPPSGGLYFPVEKIIEIPQFLQGDPRWARAPLGPTQATLGAEGCALTSAAMVLAGYGADIDPARLNRFTTDLGGFTPEGWLYWEAAAEYPPANLWHAYEDLPSFRLIDANLLAGNPVIARIRHPGGPTHFVVIVGKRGFDYLIRDPGAPGARGVYPFKEYALPIEAIRFYQMRRPGGAAPIPWKGAPADSAAPQGANSIADPKKD